MGGILHALKIPITGFFIGGLAVIFISLLAYYSESKKDILQATIIVIIIKFVASPHTPVTAYFSVFIQGFLGYLFFSSKLPYKFSAMFLGLITLFLSSVQKVIIYTILFGYTLWDSINLFYDYIITKVFHSAGFLSTLNFSVTIISIYILVHIAGGILFGYLAGKLPEWIELNYNSLKDKEFIYTENVLPQTKKRESKFYRTKRIVFYSFIIVVLFLPYWFSGISKNSPANLIFVALRVLIILFVWYKFILPLSTKLLKKLVKKKKSQYGKEVELIIEQFPLIRLIFINSTRRASEFNGFKKIKMFLVYLFVFLIKIELPVNE